MIRWSDDETLITQGATLTKSSLRAEHRKRQKEWVSHRLARRESGGIRFMPFHFAMDAYLALHIGGPDVVWQEYRREAFNRGLSPRVEYAESGQSILDLDDALRVFELHPNQVGMLLFIGDVFTSATVFPRHEDYRQLHRSLLTDFYGATLVRSAMHHPKVPDWEIKVPSNSITSVDELSDFLGEVRRDWANFHTSMVSGMLNEQLEAEETFRLGDFSLRRFLPSLDPERANHLGEAIVSSDADGRPRQLAYLKTFRLTPPQVRRGYLLKQLAAADWNLDRCAKTIGTSRHELLLRLERAGFGALLKSHVLEEAQRVIRGGK